MANSSGTVLGICIDSQPQHALIAAASRAMRPYLEFVLRSSDEKRVGYLAAKIMQPRLYQLIRQKGPIVDRSFEVEFLDLDVHALDFTFG